MKTICVDPVSAALLTTRHKCENNPWDANSTCRCNLPPFLSFVTVDRPPPIAACNCGLSALTNGHHADRCAVFGPSPWIGQRVALYAQQRSWLDIELRLDRTGNVIPASSVIADAIVGSGTLAEALPIYDDEDDPPPDAHITVVRAVRTRLLLKATNDGNGRLVTDISDQLPLQDWSPGRWALRFTDVAPTGERCPECEYDERFHAGQDHCRVCFPQPAPVVAPVLAGEGTYSEWTI